MDAVLKGLDDLFHHYWGSVSETSPTDPLGTALLSDGAIKLVGGHNEVGTAEARSLAIRQYSQNSDRHRYGTYSAVDEDLWEIFAAWIAFLHSEAKVVLILSPYHPAIYPKMVSHPQNHLAAIEARVRALGAESNIPVIGSYNPENARVDETHFTDGDHLRESGLSRLLGDHFARTVPNDKNGGTQVQ